MNGFIVLVCPFTGTRHVAELQESYPVGLTVYTSKEEALKSFTNPRWQEKYLSYTVH